jgi:hypothetical protein
MKRDDVITEMSMQEMMMTMIFREILYEDDVKTAHALEMKAQSICC